MNKLVEEAPYHPGYEDAVVSPAPKYKGVDPAKMIWKNDELIRQQADRIAELEKLLEHSVGSDCREMRYVQEIENKDARIAELEKNLSAYIVELELHKAMIQDLEKELKRIKFAWNLAENEIERIASQIKPLSDGRIQEISHRYHYTSNPDYVGFAKAVLKEMGIK